MRSRIEFGVVTAWGQELMGTQRPLAKEPLRVLIVEDSAEDTDRLVLELKRGGYAPIFRRVDTVADMAAALEAGVWDLVLSDYSMLSFQMGQALDIIRQRGIDLPFVIVSATAGEDAAVSAMKAGAQDYVLKNNLHRLGPAIRSAEGVRIEEGAPEAGGTASASPTTGEHRVAGRWGSPRFQ